MCGNNALRIIFVLAGLSCAGSSYSASDMDYADPAVWRISTQPQQLTPHQQDIVTLGKQLFFDPRLSIDDSMSCATCHQPDKGWSDGMASPLDRHGIPIGRGTPGLLNLARHSIFMWDGRAASLVEQAALPIMSPREMNMDLELLAFKLDEIPAYESAFERLFPDGVTPQNIQIAIAQFEATLVSGESDFSAWADGDSAALDPQQLQGFQLFINPQKGNCVACHHPPDFTDNGFHNLGLIDLNQPEADLGRYKMVPVKSLKGAFKTPGLWDVELTAPYFHDGSAATLESVMDYYIDGGRHLAEISPNMKPLNLNQQEKQALVAFLKSLTSREAGR